MSESKPKLRGYFLKADEVGEEIEKRDIQIIEHSNGTYETCERFLYNLSGGFYYVLWQGQLYRYLGDPERGFEVAGKLLKEDDIIIKQVLDRLRAIEQRLDDEL